MQLRKEAEEAAKKRAEEEAEAARIRAEEEAERERVERCTQAHAWAQAR